MEYRASLDKTSKTVTVLITILFLFVIGMQITLFAKYHNWLPLATTILLVCVYIISYVFHPVSYRVEKDNIIVHRLASDIVFSRSDIKNIELLQDAKLKGTIRTFGVGGLFGYFGQFMNHEMGCMTWYATKHHTKTVLIELQNNKKIIITPDEPEQFVHQLQMIA